MSATIAQQVFVAGGNRLYLSLLGDEYVRQLSISNNWTRLHIGLLLSVDYSANMQAFDMRVGVCSYGNPTQGAYAWSTKNWLGLVYGHSTGLCTGTFNAAGGVTPYINVTNYAGVNYQIIKRIGQTSTLISQGSPILNFPTNAGASTFRRAVLVVQVTKGTTNYTVASFGTVSAALAQLDYTFENMLEATQQISATPSYIGSQQLTAIVAPTAGACSEVPGIFDAISIAWHSRIVPLQIYGIAVYRVY